MPVARSNKSMSTLECTRGISIDIPGPSERRSNEKDLSDVSILTRGFVDFQANC